MARLVTSGGEIRDHSTTNVGSPDGWSAGAAATTTDTTTFRSGLAAIKCAGTSANTSFRAWPFTAPASGQQAYGRVYFRLSALPTALKKIAALVTSADGALISARLNSNGTLELWNDVAAAQIGSDSTTVITTDTWYRLQLRLKIAAGAADEAELLIAPDDGQSPDESLSGASLTVSDTHAARWRAGWVDAPGAPSDMLLDDVAVNDSTGTKQTSWPGEGSITLHVPAESNVAGGTVTDCSGGTAGIANGLNNTPPKGIADHTTAGHASDPEQVRLSGSIPQVQVVCDTTSYASLGAPGDVSVISIGAEGAQMGSGTASGTNGDQLAQSFLVNGTLEAVELHLQKVGSPTDTLSVEIREDNAGVPSSTVLDTMTMAASSMGAPAAWYKFTLTAPLTCYRTLWVVLKRSGANNASNYIIWYTIGGLTLSSTFTSGKSAYLRSGSWTAATEAFRDRTMRWYTSQGARRFTLTQAHVVHGEGVSTGTKTGQIRVDHVAPSGTSQSSGSMDFTFGSDGGAAGTYPTGWVWTSTAVIYNPSPTSMGDGPRLLINKVDNSTRVGLVCFAGAYVEWERTFEIEGWLRYQKTSDSSIWWAKQVAATTAFELAGGTVYEVPPGNWAIYPDPQIDAGQDFPATLTSVTDEALSASYTPA